jgi:hypothetical protein
MRISCPVTNWSSRAHADQGAAGGIGLFGWRGERPATVAEATNGQRGEERRLAGVAHGVGYRGVEEFAVDGVVEGVAASVVGRLQPARKGERTTFSRVGRRQQAALDLGGQRERNVSLRPFEQVGVAPGGDQYVGEGVRGGYQVIDGLGVRSRRQGQFEYADSVAPLGDG